MPGVKKIVFRPLNTPTDFPIRLNDKIVYYALHKFDAERFIKSSKYKKALETSNWKLREKRPLSK